MNAAARPDWINDLDGAIDPGEGPGDDDAQLPPPDDPAQAQDDAAQQQAQAERTVPLATLLEERKRLQAQLDEERARAARFERLEAELRAMREQKPPAPKEELPAPEPEYLEDPKGYVDHKVQVAVQALKGIESKASEAQQLAQQQAMVTQVRTALAATEAEFVAKTPDYFDALAHLRQTREAQLRLIYPDAPAAALRQAIDREELQMGAALLQSGRNPSEMAYNYAKTLGYQPRPAQNQQQPGADQAQQQQQRRRLQGMGGQQAGAGPVDSELERLMAGDADEFDQAMSELFPRRR
jgi:hypothetical protein